MEQSGDTNQGKKKVSEITTFPVQFALGEIKTNTPSKPSKEQIINQAFKFHSQGNISEAVKYYQSFINEGFKDSLVFANYGYILEDYGKLKEAELIYSKAIKIEPVSDHAHYSLGRFLISIGKLQEAEINLKKAINLNPKNAKSFDALGRIQLQKGELNLSLKYFSESTKLLRGINNKVSHSLKFKKISQSKIEHDIEQFEYLASNGYESKKFTDLALLYKKVSKEIHWLSNHKVHLMDHKLNALLKDNYNLLLHEILAPQLEKEVINNSLDVENITNDYFDHEFGCTYIDNFLSLEALESLRKFLLGNTIWFDNKEAGWIGAYLGEGLASPLLLQIAYELRKKFPKILRDYPIKQIWAYKYDSRAKEEGSSLSGIHVHADPAAVNVNFWVTPNEANLNPSSGGIIVYDVEVPRYWLHKNYNSNVKRIREELKKSKGNTTVIPYKENRAVVFNSDLFHETDNYEFKEGYENRRINVTILFGDRKNS